MNDLRLKLVNLCAVRLNILAALRLMVNPNETLVWNKSLEIEIHNGENIRCIPRVLASVNESFIFRHFCFIEGIFLRPTFSNPFHRLETFKRKKKKKRKNAESQLEIFRTWYPRFFSLKVVEFERFHVMSFYVKISSVFLLGPPRPPTCIFVWINVKFQWINYPHQTLILNNSTKVKSFALKFR